MNTNKKQSNQLVYESLKNRLRSLLKDLEAKCVQKTCDCHTNTVEEIKTLEESNKNCLKQSKKIKKLHNDFQTLAKQLEAIRNTTCDDSKYSHWYDEINEKIFRNRSFLNSLQKRNTFICNSLKNLHYELESSQNNINTSNAVCKIGDCKSNSCLRINKKLVGLKQKCDKLRTRQQNILNWCVNNPKDLETYANDYFNYYNNLLRLYADRIATMSDLCDEYKRIIKENIGSASSISLKQVDDLKTIDNNASYYMSSLTSELTQINTKLQKEVKNIGLAMEKLRLM